MSGITLLSVLQAHLQQGTGSNVYSLLLSDSGSLMRVGQIQAYIWVNSFHNIWTYIDYVMLLIVGVLSISILFIPFTYLIVNLFKRLSKW